MKVRGGNIASAALLAAAALFLGHLLFSAIAAYSAQNYLMSDYGVYTNTIYNIAHGNGFKFLAEHSYLKTHLSFSLVLLAPLFWVFRTPMILIFVQWLFLAGGAGIIFRIMHRKGADPLLSSSVVFFMCAYPMTQSVMLSEFHGVSAYYLLIPWLVHEILFRKKMSAIPLSIILGLREDAGLLVLPILIYFAVSQRWKQGYILAGISLLYTAAAVFIIYPAINGESLFAVRSMEASSSGIASSWNKTSLILRAKALFWVVLPASTFFLVAGRKALPVFLFPLAAIAACMLSGMERQYSLLFHYPAPVISAISAGMAVSIPTSLKPMLRTTGCISLLVITVISHSLHGFFLKGGNSHPVYSKIAPSFQALNTLRQSADPSKALCAHRKIAPYFALRDDLMTFEYFDSDIHEVQLVVCDIHELQSGAIPPLMYASTGQHYSIKSQSFPYLLLEMTRTGRPSPMTRSPVLAAAIMHSHGGDTVYDDEEGILRHWNGLDREAPITLAYGNSVLLPAGRHSIVFRIKVAPEVSKKGMGSLSLHILNEQKPLVSKEIAQTDAQSGFLDIALPLALEQAANIEPRVTGGGAELWVRSIKFLKAADSNDETL